MARPKGSTTKVNTEVIDKPTPTTKKPPVRPPAVEFYPEDGDAAVLKALRLYSNLERIFIGNKGGMYIPETFTRSLDNDAKLYTNPFYVKK